MGVFLACKLFLHKTISNKMFHSDYRYIINKLPKSLVKKVCKRFLHNSKDPVPLESIFRKSKQIEFYLRYTLEVYEKSLNQKHKNMDQEKNIVSLKLDRM
jgi:hypothetical protein